MYPISMTATRQREAASLLFSRHFTCILRGNLDARARLPHFVHRAKTNRAIDKYFANRKNENCGESVYFSIIRLANTLQTISRVPVED